MDVKNACLLMALATATCSCVVYHREPMLDRYLSVKLDVGYSEASLDDVLSDIDYEIGQIAGTNLFLFDDQTAMHSHDRWMTLPHRVISLRDLLPVIEEPYWSARTPSTYSSQVLAA